MVINRKSVVKLGMECLLFLAVADGVTRHGNVEPYGADGRGDDDDDDVDDDDATPGPHIRQDFTHSLSCSLQQQFNLHTANNKPQSEKKNRKSVTSALRRPPLRQSVNWKRLCLAGLE